MPDAKDIDIRDATPDDAVALAELVNALDLDQGDSGTINNETIILRNHLGVRANSSTQHFF